MTFKVIHSSINILGTEVPMDISSIVVPVAIATAIVSIVVTTAIFLFAIFLINVVRRKSGGQYTSALINHLQFVTVYQK